MPNKHPKLVKVEKDFEKIQKIINLESKEDKRSKEILGCLALYDINDYSACVQLYKLYGLRNSIFLHREIMEKVKELIINYSPKAISFLKLKKTPTLFNV